MKEEASIVPIERIENKIYLIRGHKVLLDSDLAELYGVETRVFNQAVKRNFDRFPTDFMFQLADDEFKILMSQNVISSSNWGGRRKIPYAFTEHGAIMAASILKSKRSVEVSVAVVRAFVKMREMLAENAKLSKRLKELENRMDKNDTSIVAVMSALRRLIGDKKSKRPIGFHAVITEKDKK